MKRYFEPKNRRWISCSRKIRHESEEDATVARDNLLANTGDKLRVYKCRFCRGYHIGNKGNKYKRKIKRV